MPWGGPESTGSSVGLFVHRGAPTCRENNSRQGDSHMKLPLMAALAALTFWGCSSQSENTRPDDTAQTSATGGSGKARSSNEDPARVQAEEEAEAKESPLEASDVVDNERRDRQGAPTVYDGEAT